MIVYKKKFFVKSDEKKNKQRGNHFAMQIFYVLHSARRYDFNKTNDVAFKLLHRGKKLL